MQSSQWRFRFVYLQLMCSLCSVQTYTIVCCVMVTSQCITDTIQVVAVPLRELFGHTCHYMYFR